MDGLSGFASGAFEFFRELAQNNNQQWFNHNRERYDHYVVGSFRALLQELALFLRQLNPHFETSGKTNRNFSRINRDIRFSKDKSPYKSNFYLYVFDCQREPQADGRLYVGLSADCLTVSFSVYASWKAGRKRVLESIFRPRVKVHPELWQNLLDRVVRRGHYETYWYRHDDGGLTQHPGLPRRPEDRETLQAWVVRRVFRPNACGLGQPSFARRVVQI